MSTKVILPKSGMGIDEATISRWLKSVGDRVEQGETIVEIETAKATQEIEAPAGGTLRAIYVQAGELAAVHAEIALID